MSATMPENDFEIGPDPWAAHAAVSARARRARQLPYRLGFLGLLLAGVAVGFFLIGEGGRAGKKPEAAAEVAEADPGDAEPAPTPADADFGEPDPRPPAGAVKPPEPPDPVLTPQQPMPRPMPMPPKTPETPADPVGELTEYVGHAGPVQGVAVSDDGERLLSLGGDHKVLLWQVGEAEPVFTHELEGPAIGVGFARDGRLLVAAEGAVSLIDPAGGEVVRTYPTPGGNYMAIAVAADGSRFVTASSDATLRVWSVDDDTQPVAALTLPVDVQATSVAVTPGGERAIAGYSDGSVVHWDIVGDRHSLREQAHEDRVDAVAVAADASLIVTVGGDLKMRVWRSDLRRPLNRAEAGSEYALSVAFSPDQRLLAVVGTADEAAVWSLADSERVAAVPIPGGANCVAFAPDNKSLLIGCRDNVLRHYPVNTAAAAPE